MDNEKCTRCGMTRNLAFSEARGRFESEIEPATHRGALKLNGELRVDLHRICDLLVLIGTEEAALFLIKIFRSVKRQGISSYGYKDDSDKGDDDVAAMSIVEMPRGISIVKNNCNHEELERILVLASSYSEGNLSRLIPELESLATPLTIVWIVECLTCSHQPQRRADAKASLVNLAKKAHDKLLFELGRAKCAEPNVQTLFWTEILDVLRQSGDKHCIKPIQHLLKRSVSPQVMAACSESLDHIYKRAGIAVTKGEQPQPEMPKLASKPEILAAIDAGWKTDIFFEFSSIEQFALELKLLVGYMTRLPSLADECLFAGFDGGRFNDMVIVKVLSPEGEIEWETQRRMGNLAIVEKETLSKGESEIRLRGGSVSSNYALPNAVLTSEGIKLFNQWVTKLQSDRYSNFDTDKAIKLLS